MDAKRIVLAILKTIVSVAFVMVVGMGVYRLGMSAYDFGYRIFAEEPMSPEPGLTMSVAIVEGKSVMEVGKILEEKGLIRNHYLFYFQEFFSNYHGEMKPGVFELSTAMTPDKMIEIMATQESAIGFDSAEPASGVVDLQEIGPSDAINVVDPVLEDVDILDEEMTEGE